MHNSIVITDVALRDGLQSQTSHVPTDAKIRLAQMLSEAGIRSIEATSFVSPKHVPQMADADDVIRNLQNWGRVSALAPNLRGLERALKAGVQEIAVVLSATDTMNKKNINMSLDEAMRVSIEVIKAALAQGIRTRAYVAVAFECPFEGLTPAERVLSLCQSLQTAGAQEIVIADTIGAAAPRQVEKLLSQAVELLPADQLSVHFHDTRGMGLANAWAALQTGIRRFDASLGGIGGCPFAPGAAGNLATEDLVLMAEQSGYETGIDLYRLILAIRYAEECLGTPLGGKSFRWLTQQQEKSQQTKTLS